MSIIRRLFLLAVLAGLLSVSNLAQASTNCWNGSGTQFNFGTVTVGQSSSTSGKVVFTCNNYDSGTRYFRACLQLQDEAPLAMSTNSSPAYRIYFNVYPQQDQSSALGKTSTNYAQVDYTLAYGSTQESYFNLVAKIIPNQTSLSSQYYYNYGFWTTIKFMVTESASQLLSCSAMPETNLRTVQLSALTNIKEGCSIASVSDMNFGALSPANKKELIANTSAKIVVKCPVNTKFAVGLGNGLNYKSSSRHLCSTDSCVSYTLYQDSAYTTKWGDNLNVDTINMTSTSGDSQSLIVYGTIPTQVWPAAGTYTDTVTVTLFY